MDDRTPEAPMLPDEEIPDEAALQAIIQNLRQADRIREAVFEEHRARRSLQAMRAHAFADAVARAAILGDRHPLRIGRAVLPWER